MRGECFGRSVSDSEGSDPHDRARKSTTAVLRETIRWHPVSGRVSVPAGRRCDRVLDVTAGSRREDGSVSLEAVRCLGFCYAAPALLDWTVPHAGPELATKLMRGHSRRAASGPYCSDHQACVLAEISKEASLGGMSDEMGR